MLSRLRNHHWRKHVEDPRPGMGSAPHLLPEIKRVLRQRRPMAILLPAPTLQPANLINPMDTIGADATERGISHDQARREVRSEINAGWRRGASMLPSSHPSFGPVVADHTTPSWSVCGPRCLTI